jgi:hypothetical protein
MAYKLATQKNGYLDGGEYARNGIPDVMERPYQVGFNDCSTGNAHVACMFNDECTAEFGQLEGMRSNSARHATTLYRGADGTEFECDFTPGSSGIFIRSNADTRVGPAFPDPTESIDPAYDCERNGAGYSPLNAGGASGGMPGNLATMLALLQLMQNSRNNQLAQGPPSQNEEGNGRGDNVISFPTPTPTPTQRPPLVGIPTSEPAAGEEDGSRAMLNSEFSPLDFERVAEKPAGKSKARQAEDIPTDAASDSLLRGKKALAMWEQDRSDIFGSER